MVKDLFLDIRIIGAPLIREADGLALSSRNSYLSAEDRKRALGLSKALKAVRDAAKAGTDSVEELKRIGSAVLEENNLKKDYLEIVDASSLKPLDKLSGGVSARALTAAYCGKVRLIDNIQL